jgi:hypothetical protein
VVRIGTVHLESMDNAEMRKQQLTQIFNILKDTASSDNNNNNSTEVACEHLFFMGDFNFGPSQQSQEQLVHENGFKDTWPVLEQF